MSPSRVKNAIWLIRRSPPAASSRRSGEGGCGLRGPGSPTRGANQYTSVSTLPLLRALLLRPRFRGGALPSNERVGLLGRLHESLDRRRLKALALTARKIARRNI